MFRRRFKPSSKLGGVHVFTMVLSCVTVIHLRSNIFLVRHDTIWSIDPSAHGSWGSRRQPSQQKWPFSSALSIKKGCSHNSRFFFLYRDSK